MCQCGGKAVTNRHNSRDDRNPTGTNDLRADWVLRFRLPGAVGCCHPGVSTSKALDWPIQAIASPKKDSRLQVAAASSLSLVKKPSHKPDARSHGCERAWRASHAIGARRRSGARERVSGSPRGEAPRMRLVRPGRSEAASCPTAGSRDRSDPRRPRHPSS
jgi:hypothetical protein